MNEFSYLSVLLSIIYGLAITHLLQGWRNAVLHRARLRDYWPIHVWATFLLMVNALSWWAMFGLRDRHDWEFDEFAVLLVHGIVLYLASGLLYPDFGVGGAIDLHAHYYTNHRYLFCTMAATVVMTFARIWCFHAPVNRANFGFLAFYLVASLGAAVTANKTYHQFMTVFVAGSFVACIALLFSHLH